MEYLPALTEYTDHEIGRLVQAIADTGQNDNTLILDILGDNGASAEGGANGPFSELSYRKGAAEPLELQI